MKVDWENVRPDEPQIPKSENAFAPIFDKVGEQILGHAEAFDKSLEGCKNHWSPFMPKVKPTPECLYLINPIPYELVDKSMPKLERATKGSAGIDLYSRQDERIPPFAMGYKIPLNVKLQIPSQAWVLLACRSSFPLKWAGLVVANSLGVVDQDFSQEICLLVTNLTSDIKIIPRGSRIAQMIFMPSLGVTLKEVELIEDNPDHAGFGSTGKLTKLA